MNILMILDGEFPPDERVEKEALTLISAGNRVFILCLNYGDSPDSENYRGIGIIRLRIMKKIRNKMLGTYLILPFYRMVWKKKIETVIRDRSINALHIHDLPLSDIGISLRNKYNLKVVCDQHEFYSVWIVRTAHYNTYTGRIVSFFSNWKKYERKYLPQSDLVITVAEPLGEMYINERGVNREKIIVLPNTPSREVFNHENIDLSVIEKYRDHFMLFYAGHIDILRGINTIIEALPMIRKTIPDFKFVLAGRFNRKYYDPIRYAEELGVLDMIEYHEWIPLQKLPSYVAASKVCIFIPPNTPEMNSTVVTKVYQNIVMHKPMIVGQPELMKSLVEKNRIGLSIKESDAGDLAEKLKMLRFNPELLRSFEENAKMIAEYYYWEVTSAPLSDQYRRLKEELTAGIQK